MEGIPRKCAHGAKFLFPVGGWIVGCEEVEVPPVSCSVFSVL